jgi:hypothetical protein
VAKGILYGAYDNVLSTVGVSAMWSGVIGAPGAATMVPTVVVDGKGATSIDPENLACPANSIVFFEAGAASKKLSEEEAVQRSVCLLILNLTLSDGSVHDMISYLKSPYPHENRYVIIMCCVIGSWTCLMRRGKRSQPLS